VPLSAIVVSVIDYRTVGVVFLPDGKDVEEVRLLGAHLFYESDEEKKVRVKVLKKTLKIAENQEEGRYLAASVSVAGKTKNGIIVADVIVAFGCSISLDDMKIKCVHEDSLIISMETIAKISVLTRFRLLKKKEEKTETSSQIAGKSHWIQKALGRSQHIGYVKHMARRHHVDKAGESLSRSDLKKLMSVAKKTKSPSDDRRVQLALTLSKLHHKRSSYE
jgi:hypothetical protein